MAKGKDAKGAGKGQPENYKTELCRFFQQGCCGKGSTCPFAHGEHELRGDAVQKDNSRMKDADVMCWLQARRQQGGKAGEEFERQWKAWCKANQLSEVSKAERVKSIYAFREAAEGTPDETTSTTSQKPEKPAKTKKPKSNKSPKCPQGHLMSDLLCAEGDEYECDGCSREVKSGRFYDCRDCDYSLCVTCGRETDSKDEDPTAPGQSAEADTAEGAEGAEGAERAWKAGVRTLQEKLWAAVPLRLTLPDDLTLSDEVMSAIRQRCAVQAGGVFSSSQQCLVNTCLGEQNLAAVSNTLRLRRWLQQPLSCQEEHSRATLCLLQALWGGSPGQREAAEAVIDFVVIVGLSHFIALGVTASVTSGDSDDEGDEAAAPEEHQEPEEAARGRRVEAQQEKTSTRRWDYTGGYRPAEKESNEEATLRLINAKGRTREDAGEDPKDAKFKKELCRYFENGHCDKGQHCSFAHGPSELRGAGSQARFKMDLCDFFARGYCVKGENCTYAHGPAELCIAGSSSPERPEPSPPNFKRHICTYYEKGQCDKGNKCTFAHGFAELRAGKGPGKGVHKGPSWERGPEAAPANAWRARKVI